MSDSDRAKAEGEGGRGGRSGTFTGVGESRMRANDGGADHAVHARSPIDWPSSIEMIGAAIAATRASNDAAYEPAERLWARTRNAAPDASQRVIEWRDASHANDADALEIEPMGDEDSAPISIPEPSIVARAFDSSPPGSAHWVTAHEDRGSAPTLEMLAVPRAISIGFAPRSSDSDPFAMRVPDTSALGLGAFVPPRVSVPSVPARERKPSEVSTLPPPPPEQARQRADLFRSVVSSSREVFFVAIGFAVGSLCTSAALHGALPATPGANTTASIHASVTTSSAPSGRHAPTPRARLDVRRGANTHAAGSSSAPTVPAIQPLSRMTCDPPLAANHGFAIAH